MSLRSLHVRLLDLALFGCVFSTWAAAAEQKAVLAKTAALRAESHWAFQTLHRPLLPAARGQNRIDPVNHWIGRKLAEARLTASPTAGRSTLIRRVAFALTGLPPTPEEIAAYTSDSRPGAYMQMVERYLASPRYGERWGKHWLDAAGYADSNGYFNADTDRPLAYRYRDYVIRSLNRDQPFDQFVREQLAGDELSGWKPGQPASPQIIELLEATHFLRNGQDGSGESDGNPDEVRTDRYYALESTMQIIGSSLLGLTMQCAKCHDHKFEPLRQRDYYAFQAFLYPAFNIEKWVAPKDRVTHAHLPGELEAWTAKETQVETELAALKTEFNTWLAKNRPAGRVLFADRFDLLEPLATRWSNTAPGDDAPAGSPPVAIGSGQAPGALVQNGALQIIESGGPGNRWLSTRKSFDWRPARTGEWIQVTFDLVALQLDGKGKPAERVGYYLALHDFNGNSPITGGNILIDGNPSGPTTLDVDYPGTNSNRRGNLTPTHYKAGNNYGVRVTRKNADKFTVEHLVDGVTDGGSLTLAAADLPPGGFGFEYCCGRSFIVDNVSVEAAQPDDEEWSTRNTAFQKALAERKQSLATRSKELEAQRSPKPGRIAWVSDLGTEPPDVHLLLRGDHKARGEVVAPAFPAFLQAGTAKVTLTNTATTTGRRLAWANWLTAPGSPQAALLARVTVNRVWQQHFGTGLAATPDNLGLSGARPSHPELLEWLATEFVESGWSLKSLHRLILQSGTYRQSSAPQPDALARDPSNQLLWRFPIRRLDAESIRDAMLATSGKLAAKTSGPYVPTPRAAVGEIIVDESKPEAFARSVFLQQRRTQVNSFLGTFDAPSIVFNCTRRAETTMPLQALSQLNSDFAVKRGADLAQRLLNEAGPDATTVVQRGFLLTLGRRPDAAEQAAALRFFAQQCEVYADKPDATQRAWADFGQSLFGLNEFLYVE